MERAVLKWRFELQAARQTLPQIDVASTLISCVLSEQRHAALVRWAVHHRRIYTGMQRIAMVGIAIVGLVCPIDVDAPSKATAVIDVLVNISITLSMLIAARLAGQWNQRGRGNIDDKTVRCVIVQATLRFGRAVSDRLLREAPPPVSALPRAIRRRHTLSTISPLAKPRVPRRASITTADVVLINARWDEQPRGAPPVDIVRTTDMSTSKQPLTLVQWRVQAVDARRTCGLPLTGTAISNASSLLHKLLGAVGLCTSVVAVSCSSSAIWVVQCLAVLGFVATLCFLVPFLLLLQRQLLTTLIQSTDVLVLSLQAIAAVLTAAQVFAWDVRVLCLVTWLLWFHWLLVLDALTPLAKRQLQFSKRMALPAMLTLVVGAIVVILLALVTSFELFVDSPLLPMQRGANESVLSTTRFLLHRLATIVLLAANYLWILARSPEDTLTLLRGRVEYQTAVSFMPKASVHPSATALRGRVPVPILMSTASKKQPYSAHQRRTTDPRHPRIGSARHPKVADVRTPVRSTASNNSI
ncbi:TPA: hypothetical protein N0F65_008377 [Lagenidium giganteum]|uniref:Uncharacterized protein n=1 Tax=Lagenidium giganteum TaxID=4803 RepID=A0AAV2Z125_9STRA|nr:TPA: hypothetical protein N0F65_008377 [Lagenidium giganteum]